MAANQTRPFLGAPGRRSGETERVRSPATSIPPNRKSTEIRLMLSETMAVTTGSQSMGVAPSTGSPRSKRKISQISISEGPPAPSGEGNEAERSAVIPPNGPALYSGKGRRIMLCDVQYEVDVAALEAHANTPEAKSAWASYDLSKTTSRLTEHDLIKKFLDDTRRVKRMPNGRGICTFSYTPSDLGQALVEAGFLELGGRLYPDVWPCATSLPKKLRNCALGAHYVEYDDSSAFHHYLHSLTTNTSARAVMEEFLCDKGYRSRLAEHYFGDATRTEPVKILFHMLANDGLCKDWRREHKIKRNIPDHPMVDRMQTAMKEVAEELANTDLGRRAVAFIQERKPTKLKTRFVKGKKRQVRVAIDPKLTWKSYLLQELEVRGLLAKIRTAREQGVAVGPPLHDGLFVARLPDTRKLEELARAMTTAVCNSTGSHIEVEIKDIPSAALETGFELAYDRDTFKDTDFRSNGHLDDDCAIVQSLDTYNRWLSRFFVAVLKHRKPEVVEIIYYPGTDRIQRVIPRSHADTKAIYLNMDILTATDAKPTKLFEWFLERNVERRTAHRVQMWVRDEDIRANPQDLNLYGGLPYDDRFEKECDASTKTQFKHPFPEPFVDARNDAARRKRETDWRDEEGLRFILWHLQFILCGGDPKAFEYALQWFAYVIQKRQKPATILVLYGPQGVGKSALVSINESGVGILPRIYGGIHGYFQTCSNIDHVLKDFNADNMNKLFCCLEEATPYKKGHRNNDQLGALITNETMRVEMKSIDAIHVNDYRAFCCCTNNRDAFKIAEGDRRHVMLEADDRFSQLAVKEGRCTTETRMEYCAKLSRIINDDIAYEFFKLCMLMDISDFKPQTLYETDLHREQQAQHECALKAFLQAAQSGEYSFAEHSISMLGLGEKQGWRYLTSLQLLEHFRRYLDKSGLCSSIDNIKSLGWAVKRYPEMVQKLDEGRCVRYAIRTGS